MSKLIDLNINNEINNEVFESKNNELSSELEEYNNLKEELLNNKNRIAKEEKRLKLIEKELINTKTIHTFDDEVFKKLIKKIIIGDYNEDGSYNPNVIKFVLNITNNDDDSQIKFLSLEIDERNHSSKGLWRMKKIKEEKMNEIMGGQIENVTGPIINAIVNVVNLLKDAGYSIGSGIRRIAENNICPLE